MDAARTRQYGGGSMTTSNIDSVTTDERVERPMNDMRPNERATLEVRLNDLLRFLNAPGDWGYHTPMADLTLYLLRFRQKLQQSEK